MLDWGGTTDKGFTAVSRAFLQHYVRLGISMEEAMLILHVLDYAWNGSVPFPKVATLCRYSGKSEKTIRTYIRSLRNKGLLKTRSRQGRSNEYDFSPLFSRLKEVATLPSHPDEKPVAKAVPQEIELLDAPEVSVTEETTPDLPTQATQVSPSRSTRIVQQPKNNTGTLSRTIEQAMSVASAQSKGRKKARTSPTAAKRVRSFLEKDPRQYNCNDMELVLGIAWKETGWKTPPPKFTSRDRKHAKDLISHYGASNVARVIKEAIGGWTDYSGRLNVNGYPSMPLFWGYRNSIFPMVLDGKGKKKGAGTQFDESTSREDGSEIGW